jgi:hypothetical protein
MGHACVHGSPDAGGQFDAAAETAAVDGLAGARFAVTVETQRPDRREQGVGAERSTPESFADNRGRADQAPALGGIRVARSAFAGTKP